MKFTLNIDSEREEEVIVFAHERNSLTKKIEELASGVKAELVGYKNERIKKIDQSDVYCFYLEGGKLFALLDEGKFHIKMRLYELEEILGDNFVKINQSAIANIQKIESFGVSPGASLTVNFKNGYTDYVSRRQVKSVKQKLGI